MTQFTNNSACPNMWSAWLIRHENYLIWNNCYSSLHTLLHLSEGVSPQSYPKETGDDSSVLNAEPIPTWVHNNGIQLGARNISICIGGKNSPRRTGGVRCRHLRSLNGCSFPSTKTKNRDTTSLSYHKWIDIVVDHLIICTVRMLI